MALRYDVPLVDASDPMPEPYDGTGARFGSRSRYPRSVITDIEKIRGRRSRTTADTEGWEARNIRASAAPWPNRSARAAESMRVVCRTPTPKSGAPYSPGKEQFFCR